MGNRSFFASDLSQFILMILKAPFGYIGLLWYFCGMFFKKAIWLLTVYMTCSMYMSAQVSVDHYRDDGTRLVRSQQVVMYDDFFHAARFAVTAIADAGGLVSFALEVTFDEGLLHVSKGDSLTLVLRGGDRVILKIDHDVTRANIFKRHYRTYNDYYVTCNYPMTNYDIQRITRNRVTKLSAQTDRFTFDRKLDKSFQERFRQQFTAVYRYLMEV